MIDWQAEHSNLSDIFGALLLRRLAFRTFPFAVALLRLLLRGAARSSGFSRVGITIVESLKVNGLLVLTS